MNDNFRASSGWDHDALKSSECDDTFDGLDKIIFPIPPETKMTFKPTFSPKTIVRFTRKHLELLPNGIVLHIRHFRIGLRWAHDCPACGGSADLEWFGEMVCGDSDCPASPIL